MKRLENDRRSVMFRQCQLDAVEDRFAETVVLVNNADPLSRFLHWCIRLWPIAEIAQCGFAGTAGVDGGPYIEKAAKYVVMHPGDFR